MGIVSPDWMTTADLAIVWFLNSHATRFYAPPMTFSTNLPVSNTHSSNRCSLLAEVGLLERHPEKEGYYQISDFGVRWIRGEVTREELEDRKPDSV